MPIATCQQGGDLAIDPWQNGGVKHAVKIAYQHIRLDIIPSILVDSPVRIGGRQDRCAISPLRYVRGENSIKMVLLVTSAPDEHLQWVCIQGTGIRIIRHTTCFCTQYTSTFPLFHASSLSLEGPQTSP